MARLSDPEAYEREAHRTSGVPTRTKRAARKQPNYIGARNILENELRIQFRKDAVRGRSRAIPVQLQDKWWGHDSRQTRTPLSTLNRTQTDELAREVANWNAHKGIHQAAENEVRAKQRRGEAM